MGVQSLVSATEAFLDHCRNKINASPHLGLVGVLAIWFWMPFEFSELTFAFMGALTYLFLQGAMPRGQTPCQRAAEREQAQYPRNKPTSTKAFSNRQRSACIAGNTSAPAQRPTTKPDVYKVSALPILAPKFESCGFDAEVDELVHQLTPTTDEIVGVEKLTQYFSEVIQAILPKADVTAFVHGSLKRGTAFSVAVPEVDLVVRASPAVLTQIVNYRSRRGPQDVGEKKLIKSAIRLCADQLLSKGGITFRRSAFRGDDPRMTLLVMPSLGFFTEGIPVDFSVNAVTPFYTSAILTETGRIEPQAKALMLFVKRWAKDRGICHSSKGHLSPFMWNLLVMYFMQVREDGPLLPGLEDSTMFSGLRLNSSNAGQPQLPKYEAASTSGTMDSIASPCQQPLGLLFNDFVKFFRQEFDWHCEAVCVRLGRRARPDPQLPRGVFGSNADKQMLGPVIEDPFDTHRNLATCMNAVSVARLHAELQRAVELCEHGASLSDLLTPWAPEAEDVVDRDASSDRDA